jgi:putative sporulation protein YyaC
LNKIRTHHKDPIAFYEIAYFLKDYIVESTVIVCIGTDRCIGDCLGPMVGTLLKQNKFPFPVFGTIEEPIHALNIDKKLEEIYSLYPSSVIIGIDACLGESGSVGEIQARDIPIHPGKGVGKSLQSVGKLSIIGIVDSNESDELFTSRNIRLNLIIEMAIVICDALLHSIYLHKLLTESGL